MSNAPMTKGDRTRDMILDRAAQLFSRQGYFGASMSDIMRETGLEKGGIYNHFRSKDDLALAAFDHARELINDRMRDALKGRTHAVERLLAVVHLFRGIIDDPLLEGGCPILNTAVESDDAHPALAERARAAADDWQSLIRHFVSKGIGLGEIRAEADAESVATVMIATLEGGVMLSKLYADPIHIHRAAEFLETYIETTLRA